MLRDTTRAGRIPEGSPAWAARVARERARFGAYALRADLAPLLADTAASAGGRRFALRESDFIALTDAEVFPRAPPPPPDPPSECTPYGACRPQARAQSDFDFTKSL